MQMYRGAFLPKYERLFMREVDTTKTAVSWNGAEIQLKTQKTGISERHFLVCPNCEKGRTELRYYKDPPIHCCKQCDPYDRSPYHGRTTLLDERPGTLVRYHVDKQRSKLEEVGVEVHITYGKLTVVNSLDGRMVAFRPESFDYKKHIGQKPKHRHMSWFIPELIKFHLLCELWNESMKNQVVLTGKEIRERISKYNINDFIDRA